VPPPAAGVNGVQPARHCYNGTRNGLQAIRLRSSTARSSAA